MQLAVDNRGEVMIVQANEQRIDASVAIQFKDRMRDLMQQHSAPRVILDLRNVTFLDSSGLGAVVAVRKLLGPDRVLELSGLTETVEKVFRLTRMDTIFTIHAAPPDGLRDAG
jgi:anti-sigma B factor antagonist